MISQLKTIFAKEFYSYFSNISAYFAVGVYVILTLASAFYFGDFFKIDNSNLISLFGPQPEILSLLIPAICMPLWSEEYRSGTIEFLLTQPVEYRVLIIGKYLASVAFCFIMLFLTLPIFITTAIYIGVNLGTVMCGYFGILLTILVFAALCNLMSLLSSRPLIAYLAGFLVIRVLMSFKFEHLSGLSFEQNYQNIITGRISLSSFIYFASIIILILWSEIACLTSQKKN